MTRTSASAILKRRRERARRKATKKEIGEPYWFALCANVYGNAKAAGKNRTRFRVYGPCLDAHNIGCSLITGEVRWTTDKDGEALPEMKWKDVG